MDRLATQESSYREKMGSSLSVNKCPRLGACLLSLGSSSQSQNAVETIIVRII